MGKHNNVTFTLSTLYGALTREILKKNSHADNLEH